MAIITRQTGLLSAENWKKVYQTFREADFTAYDFETLRKSMIDYIKLNYSEDFNDFTESSEFVALIDLIAFFGQSLAFRTDLNARENFIDTAERRDSILKLARLISYNPKRTVAAHGFLKIDSVTTTEIVYDSDGINLSGSQILWNDPANENWLEQFNTILNSVLVDSQVIGKPANSKKLNGIRNDEYSVNVVPGVVPVFRFESAVEGNRTTFEAVGATSYNQSYVYETAPKTNGVFNLLYKNDNLGNNSNNTGYFVYFKQGELNSIDFTINDVVPNKIINIDVANINNSDVWLYSLDSSGALQDLWENVPATSGINVIYNNRTDRNLYQINSRTNDQISLVFGDGSFSNVPQGNFRLYYRVSNGLTYKISPEELRSIQVSIDYVSRYNKVETVTLRASLMYTVGNALARETVNDIKERAPQQYYSQNRMVTGEDYNILPFTSFSSVQKVKAVNRTSSGLSRYLDVLDTTGKYSSTNIYGDDGVLYLDEFSANTEFYVGTNVDIKKIVYNTVLPTVVTSQELLHYYYANVSVESPIASSISANALVNTVRYTISSAGTTDFTQFGAANNNVGTSFVADNAGNKTKSYSVTASGNANYVFGGNVSGTDPDILSKIGDVLVFNVSAPGHPFWIKTFPGTGNANAVTTGLTTNNGIASGTVTWNTSNVTAGTYYYSSENHANLSGNIIISSFGTGQVTSDLIWVLSTVGDSASTGYFTYNNTPSAVGNSVTTQSRYIKPGAIIKFRAPVGYYFNSMNNLVLGTVSRPDVEKNFIHTTIVQLYGNGTNNGQGNFANGTGPVVTNIKVPTGAIVDEVTPAFENEWTTTLTNLVIDNLTGLNNFGMTYDSDLQSWQFVAAENLNSSEWYLKFVYDSKNNKYTLTYKGIKYVFHSPAQTNFYFDPALSIYDSENNRVIRDHVKVLKVNSMPDSSLPLAQDYIWYISKPIVENDGYVQNKSIYLTYADTNNDTVPDIPDLFKIIVDHKINPNNKLIFFKSVLGYNNFIKLELVDTNSVISNFETMASALAVIRNYELDQLFYFTSDKEFRKVQLVNDVRVFSSALSEYKVYYGRQNLMYQYRHNSPNTNRIDPSISNIIDIYVLTKDYDVSYRQWLQDTSNAVVEPGAPTNTELALLYSELENLKSISDTIVFNSANFKPVFGSKSESSLQSIFKVVKNPNLNISDADIKTSVISAINEYFSSDNWDFGETFYFSELSAYLHRVLSPNIASIVIVPRNSNVAFGSLYQINAEANEIIISSATVDDVEIISSLSANQLNQSLSVVN